MCCEPTVGDTLGVSPHSDGEVPDEESEMSRRDFVVGLLNYNTRGLVLENLTRCIESGIPPDRILVLDNRSTDGSAEAVARAFPEVRTVQSDRNLGYAGGMNRIVDLIDAPVAALVTADCFISRDAIDELFRAIRSGNDIAIAGCRTIDLRTGRIQSEGADVTYPLGIPLSRHWQENGSTPALRDPEVVAYVAGSALLVDVKRFRELGGFDDSYFAYHEEVDLCWRARLLGYRVVCVGSARADHVTFGSFGDRPEARWALVERNRIATNIKNLSVFHLAVALAYEVLYLGAVTVGSSFLGVPSYRRAYWRGLVSLPRLLPGLWRDRRKIQRTRRRSDAEVLAIHPRRGLLALADPLRRRLSLLRSYSPAVSLTSGK